GQAFPGRYERPVAPVLRYADPTPASSRTQASFDRWVPGRFRAGFRSRALTHLSAKPPDLPLLPLQCCEHAPAGGGAEGLGALRFRRGGGSCRAELAIRIDEDGLSWPGDRLAADPSEERRLLASLRADPDRLRLSRLASEPIAVARTIA